MLVKLGAAPDPLDAEGGTPLDYARQSGHQGRIEQLTAIKLQVKLLSELCMCTQITKCSEIHKFPLPSWHYINLHTWYVSEFHSYFSGCIVVCTSQWKSGAMYMWYWIPLTAIDDTVLTGNSA